MLKLTTYLLLQNSSKVSPKHGAWCPERYPLHIKPRTEMENQHRDHYIDPFFMKAGDEIGWLTLIEKVKRGRASRNRCLCRCVCSAEIKVTAGMLNHPIQPIRSCGCMKHIRIDYVPEDGEAFSRRKQLSQRNKERERELLIILHTMFPNDQKDLETLKGNVGSAMRRLTLMSGVGYRF